MKRILFALLGILALIQFNFSQVRVSGTIFDKKTGEYLISANVFNTETLEGTVSNVYGFYSLKVRKGKVKLSASYIGYQQQEFELELTKDTLLNIALNPSVEIEEVVVSDKSPQSVVNSTQMSIMKLSPAKVKQLPVLFGETDIIKSLQLTPGVQGGTEGSSGFFVRGGGPDQNLILLDEVPVYNANHLFGFLSVFNTDAIKDVTLIKGGFPARYGGRLSSVLDIRMKEGNMYEYHGSASIGIVSSNLTLEGPIIKGKTSFIVSGRRSYFDIVSYPIQLIANSAIDNGGEVSTGYFMQDFNLKINHRFSEKSKLYLSMYTGKDKFYLKDSYDSENDNIFYDDNYNYSSNFKEDMGLQWGNFTSALRWNYMISNELFSNLTITANNYTFKLYDDWYSENYQNDTLTYKDDYYYETYSKIRDYALKYDLYFIPNPNHYIRIGFNNTLHYFSPGVTVEQDDAGYGETGIDTTYGNKDIPANEFYVYCEDDMIIGKRIKINAGLHFSAFTVQGKTYHSLEPRFSSRFLILDNLSFKASYAQMQQYLHLLSNSSMGLPTDLWVPPTKNILPQHSTQYAAGFSYSLKNLVEFTVEGYYKEMENLLDYKEGASFFELTEGDWESKTTQGTGKSYGIEFIAQKTTGKTSGWISYTYSRSMRHFSEISFGKTYPYRYDSPHDISIVLTHKFNEKWDVGATWVFRTGYPVTLEDEKFISPDYFSESDDNNYYSYYYYDNESSEEVSENDYVKYFETRNSYRMPNYHRLDICANRHKQVKKTERTLSIGAYNVYCKKNPMFFFARTEYNYETGEPEVQIVQISVLPCIIPYIRYSIKF